MRKKIAVVGVCVVLLLLFGAVGFASMHGLFEGYPVVKVVVNGQEIKGDVPAINFKGRTMVPVRFVSEALGADIAWDAENETVIIKTDGTAVSTPKEPAPAPSKNEYTVKDATGKALYSFKINKVTEMAERNPYSEKTPEQVIMIDYTYTNIANEEDVFLSDIYFKVVDSAGEMGYTYPNSPTDFPQYTPVGATCKAQIIFGLDTKSETVTLYFHKDLYGPATAIFAIPIK